MVEEFDETSNERYGLRNKYELVLAQMKAANEKSSIWKRKTTV